MDTKTIYDNFVRYIGEHARERDNNNRVDIMYITNLKPSSFYVGNDAYVLLCLHEVISCQDKQPDFKRYFFDLVTSRYANATVKATATEWNDKLIQDVFTDCCNSPYIGLHRYLPAVRYRPYLTIPRPCQRCNNRTYTESADCTTCEKRLDGW